MLYLLFLLTYILSCLRFLGNDINNFGKNELVALFLQSLNTISINLFIVTPISFLFFISSEKNIFFVPLEIYINYYIYDFLYYFIHRNIQNNLIHYKRHNCNMVTFNSLYASPLDYFLLNIFSLYFGLIILRAHIFTYIYFTIMETYINVLTNTKMGTKSNFHIYHCIIEEKNFGINLIADKVFNTLFVKKNIY